MFSIKMASKTLQPTPHSAPNSKMGIHAEDWCVCVQAIVSHQANIYQTDLSSQHTGTDSPKS